MKIICALCALLPFVVLAAPGAVTPQSLHASIQASGAVKAIQELDEKGMKTVSNGIAGATAEWLTLLPEMAPGLDAGNAENVVIALATALPENPPAVLSAINAPGAAGLKGIDKVCSMPFRDMDDPALARYYRKTEPALKKIGKKATPCRDKLKLAMGVLQLGAQAEQNYTLNRRKLTPDLVWKAINKDGVDKLADAISDQQRQNIGDGISSGSREWLFVADTLAQTKNPQMHSMLTVSLASALTQNPCDVLKVSPADFDIGILCGMPFPNADNAALKLYYQKTQSALKKIRRRGEACLDVLEQEYSVLSK
ncbi:hypothetical protein [Rahnella woolbedingensis]|uniref:Uncharacterized protein n=1 Tax=Rahnella woolbedingensis TaxID=1510574 RepID=A0A419N7Q0_9GAMM|nr:hypothetical protein [Rahnella woolbedingensis]RJT43280.1 hypothetical protein D6C13_14855 [Rahnella woolbedingensis]